MVIPFENHLRMVHKEMMMAYVELTKEIVEYTPWKIKQHQDVHELNI